MIVALLACLGVLVGGSTAAWVARSRHVTARVAIASVLAAGAFAALWWVVARDGEASGPALAIRFAIHAAFAVVLLVIALQNIDTMLIYNRITYPAIAAFAVASLALPGRRWFDGLLGAAVGYAVPRIIAQYYERVHRRSGLGTGVFAMLAMVGALLGWRAAIATLIGASMIGSVAAGIWMAWRAFHDRVTDRDLDGTAAPGLQTEIAFAPFIALAAIGWIVAEPWLARV